MSVKLRLKRLYEGEVPLANLPAANQLLNLQEPVFNAEEALNSINAYYTLLFDGVKALCTGDAVIKTVPSLKDANANANSPYNALAKAVSDAIAAMQKLDAKTMENIPELLKGFNTIINTLNEYSKAITNAANQLQLNQNNLQNNQLQLPLQLQNLEANPNNQATLPAENLQLATLPAENLQLATLA